MTTITHGAYSDARLRSKARGHKRRFLQRLGVRAASLDAITREKLNHWARGQAQLDLFDATGERGSRNYWTAYNGVTRALHALEARVKEAGLDKSVSADDVLRAHLETRYGENRS